MYTRAFKALDHMRIVRLLKYIVIQFCFMNSENNNYDCESKSRQCFLSAIIEKKK